jgi:hypothetical protein
MEEIAATFEGSGMPGGFHASAAEVYRRIAGFKDAAKAPSLTEVLKALLICQSSFLHSISNCVCLHFFFFSARASLRCDNQCVDLNNSSYR